MRGLGPPSFLPLPPRPSGQRVQNPLALLPLPAVAFSHSPRRETALRFRISVSFVTSSTFVGAGVEWVLLSATWTGYGAGKCPSPSPRRRCGPPGWQSNLGSVFPSPVGLLGSQLCCFENC